MTRFVALVATFAAAGFFASAAYSQNDAPWPQFRGEAASGVAKAQKPPLEFGPDKNVKWKVPVPAGMSSPIVVGDLVILTAFEKNKLYTIAYRRADGKEAWRREAPAKEIERFHKTQGSPAASTCATDGKHIVTYFGSCGLFCYDLAGKQLWRYELPTAMSPADFGTGVSPILADGLVILVRDQKVDPKILAVDVATGTLVWEKKRESMAGFCTPTACDTPDGRQVIVAGYGKLIGYDLKTGAEKWSVAGMPAVTLTSPLVADGTVIFAGWSPGDDLKMPSFDALLKMAGQTEQGFITREGFDKTFMKGFFDNQDTNRDGKLTREEWDANQKFLASGKNSAFAVKLGGRGDVTKTHVLWKQMKGLPYVPTGIVYRGQLVLLKDGGLVTAYDARTGAKIYVQERAIAESKYYASPVAADGHIYFTGLDEGTVTVMKAGGTEPKVVATNPPLMERVAATPAIADNTIYIRTEGHLWAFAR
jgi:outer membrane protein assembly factor BamB